MNWSKAATFDVGVPAAPKERLSRLSSERPCDKTTDQLLAISRRVSVLHSSRKSPSSDERPPASTTASEVEPLEDTASVAGRFATADHDGHSGGSSKTVVPSDAKEDAFDENPPLSLDPSQHLDTSSASLPNLTSPSVSQVSSIHSSASSSRTDSTGDSSLDSLCPSLDGKQDENASSPASIEILAKHPDNPFREPVRIPGCSPPTFVYPHSSCLIDVKFQERFREVVNIFQHNTEQDPRLEENIQFIDYTLKMCGTSATDSHPSILVFCRQSEFRALNALLTSKELKYQYCLRRRSRKYPWSSSQMPGSEDHKPFFNIYFWRQRIPRTLFWGQTTVQLHRRPTGPSQQSDLSRLVAPGLTMCGSIVEFLRGKPSFSTVGCTIRIGSRWYAITTLHAFWLSSDFQAAERSKRRLAHKLITTTSLDGGAKLTDAGKETLYGSDTDPSDEDIGDSDYFIDDVEYESFEEDEAEGEQILEVGPVALVKESYSNRPTASRQLEDVKSLLALYPTPRELNESDELDLDWALVRLTDPHDWRPNLLVPSVASSKPVFLSRVAESQPDQETPVVIITCGTHRKGMIQPGTSVLGAINGRRPSAVWTVVLDNQNKLTRGDSGSIVVDAATGVIYGHVIGSNPIGEVYISPYAAIFEQIRRRFPESTISLPGPISTLQQSTSFSKADIDDWESPRYQEEMHREANIDAAAPWTRLRPAQLDSVLPSYDELVGPERIIPLCSTEIMEAGDEATPNTAPTWPPAPTIADPFCPPPSDASAPTTESDPITSSRPMQSPHLHVLPGFQSLRLVGPSSQAPYQSAGSVMSGADCDATHATRTPLAPPPNLAGFVTSVLIRRLPPITSEGSLRLMMIFSKELLTIQILPMERSEDSGFLSAILTFRTYAGAFEARKMLDGKRNISNDADMAVEILAVNPPLIQNPVDTATFSASSSTAASSAACSTAPSSTASSATSSWHPSHKNNGSVTHPQQPTSYQPLSGYNFPPVNPADQNPPCNTLYVGNLPLDTSEEELKAIFSEQPGYRRLCFRTKPNSPMCFVEFEDVSSATKAMHQLYGRPLQNSLKGGIRLSFSKNPLGVRSGQTLSQPTTAQGAPVFTKPGGPPPGLSASLQSARLQSWYRDPDLPLNKFRVPNPTSNQTFKVQTASRGVLRGAPEPPPQYMLGK
ncbi:hypothetical protein GQ53DRAFT_848008 [Thozetella sp. PMI_491]|nr:hypothetical protein GQ53DRAFT_848008 [Thozetella sp. PMI_491]